MSDYADILGDLNILFGTAAAIDMVDTNTFPVLNSIGAAVGTSGNPVDTSDVAVAGLAAAGVELDNLDTASANVTSYNNAVAGDFATNPSAWQIAHPGSQNAPVAMSQFNAWMMNELEEYPDNGVFSDCPCLPYYENTNAMLQLLDCFQMSSATGQLAANLLLQNGRYQVLAALNGRICSDYDQMIMDTNTMVSADTDLGTITGIVNSAIDILKMAEMMILAMFTASNVGAVFGFPAGVMTATQFSDQASLILADNSLVLPHTWAEQSYVSATAWVDDMSNASAVAALLAGFPEGIQSWTDNVLGVFPDVTGFEDVSTLLSGCYRTIGGEVVNILGGLYADAGDGNQRPLSDALLGLVYQGIPDITFYAFQTLVGQGLYHFAYE